MRIGGVKLDCIQRRFTEHSKALSGGKVPTYRQLAEQELLGYRARGGVQARLSGRYALRPADLWNGRRAWFCEANGSSKEERGVAAQRWSGSRDSTGRYHRLST